MNRQTGAKHARRAARNAAATNGRSTRAVFELRVFVGIEPIESGSDGRARARVTTSVGVAPSVAKPIDRFTWTEDARHAPADEQAAARLASVLAWARAQYEVS